jgi:clan AA aspartic protease
MTRGMMGFVDLHGRALIEIRVRASDIAARHDLEAWIDTGFTGDLVLPQQMIDDMELPASGTVKAALADGSLVTMERYHCQVDWFGSRRELEVVANAGERPLLGVGLLIGFDLNISYRTGKITIE